MTNVIKARGKDHLVTELYVRHNDDSASIGLFKGFSNRIHPEEFLYGREYILELDNNGYIRHYTPIEGNAMI